jgi:hypothetical protein
MSSGYPYHHYMNILLSDTPLKSFLRRRATFWSATSALLTLRESSNYVPVGQALRCPLANVSYRPQRLRRPYLEQGIINIRIPRS